MSLSSKRHIAIILAFHLVTLSFNLANHLSSSPKL